MLIFLAHFPLLLVIRKFLHSSNKRYDRIIFLLQDVFVVIVPITLFNTVLSSYLSVSVMLLALLVIASCASSRWTVQFVPFGSYYLQVHRGLALAEVSMVCAVCVQLRYRN